MVSVNDSPEKSIRISVKLDPSLHRQLRDSATRHDQTISRFVLETLEQRLRAESDLEGLTAMTAAADPVLAELWDNPRDAAYDRL